MANLLILEDDKDQAQLLKRWLLEKGHEVTHAPTGREFLDFFKANTFDLAILDWHLPDISGIDVLRYVREKMQSNIPIIFATQKNEEEDIVRALNTGADDYLVKPLRHFELMARITALLRRRTPDDDHKVLSIGPIEVDTSNQTVRLHGEKVKLTHKDYLLACCMIKNAGKVLSREFLLSDVWGIDCELHTRTVDVHVSRLRRSLHIGAGIGVYIRTIYQHGYRLEAIEG